MYIITDTQSQEYVKKSDMVVVASKMSKSSLKQLDFASS